MEAQALLETRSEGGMFWHTKLSLSIDLAIPEMLLAEPQYWANSPQENLYHSILFNCLFLHLSALYLIFLFT